MIIRTSRTIALLTLALLLAQGAILSAKRKDDVVVLTNGDRIVGEIKKLAQGSLSFKADYMLESSQIDWKEVRELHSQDFFQVLLTSGQILTASIDRAASGAFKISPPGEPVVTTAWYDVVGILPVETTFWNQLTGNINSGFSYTSGNSQTTFTASGSVAYVAARYTATVTASSTFSGQSDAPSTTRNNADFSNEFTLKPKLFVVVLGDLLNSEQQDLDLRTTLGGGIGRWFVRTGRTSLGGFGGVVYTNERYSAPADPTQTGSQDSNNIEAVLGLDFSFVRFKTTTITSRLSVFPSLTTPGRVRLNVAPNLNFEIARNLYWAFTLYENYDSQPPVNANKNDFGVTNSIGWKF
jgi:putative salt-induced outer membrane protein YdiY